MMMAKTRIMVMVLMMMAVMPWMPLTLYPHPRPLLQVIWVGIASRPSLSLAVSLCLSLSLSVSLSLRVCLTRGSLCCARCRAIKSETCSVLGPCVLWPVVCSWAGISETTERPERPERTATTESRVLYSAVSWIAAGCERWRNGCEGLKVVVTRKGRKEGVQCR
jgi:hypothetical protein